MNHMTTLDSDPMRILIVDDSAASRDLLYALLTAAGYADVIAVESGTAAIERVTNPHAPREADIDLVLLDIEMEGLDGIETCRRLQTEPHLRDTPIIMVTALAEARTLAEAFDAGAVDYIVKPIKKIELLARVRSALALKRETDSRKAREEQLVAKNLALQQALHEIQVLRGLIKICSYCEKDSKRSRHLAAGGALHPRTHRSGIQSRYLRRVCRRAFPHAQRDQCLRRELQ